MPVQIQQYIFWLDISVQNLVFVDVLKSQKDFNWIEPSLFLIHPFKFLDNIEELTAWTKLSNENDVVLGLKGELEVNHKRISSDFLHNFQLVDQNVLLLFLYYFIFFHNFHRIKFLIFFEPAEEDFGEPSRPDTFDNLKGRQWNFILDDRVERGQSYFISIHESCIHFKLSETKVHRDVSGHSFKKLHHLLIFRFSAGMDHAQMVGQWAKVVNFYF